LTWLELNVKVSAEIFKHRQNWFSVVKFSVRLGYTIKSSILRHVASGIILCKGVSLAVYTNSNTVTLILLNILWFRSKCNAQTCQKLDLICFDGGCRLPSNLYKALIIRFDIQGAVTMILSFSIIAYRYKIKLCYQHLVIYEIKQRSTKGRN
jgi:hypothetical protein